jgi:ASC-1-like (ASCH) protein
MLYSINLEPLTQNFILLKTFTLFMEYSMKLLESPYERISSGKKTIELRLFDKKRQELNVGDIIEFSKLPDLNDKVKVEIVALLRYKSFKDLLDDFGMEYYGYPKDYSVKNFLNSIYTIYSKEEEQQHGVLGIKIRLLNGAQD